MSALKAKTAKIHAEMASADKRRFFEETRKRMLEAQSKEMREEEWEAEIEMMKMFKTR
ncbi:MAG: hypothetical protein KDD45_17750 [Bdellovibrionales bacterium]|nr:hypothetical protein [Bdellovibrionales bacterium]